MWYKEKCSAKTFQRMNKYKNISKQKLSSDIDLQKLEHLLIQNTIFFEQNSKLVTLAVDSRRH